MQIVYSFVIYIYHPVRQLHFFDRLIDILCPTYTRIHTCVGVCVCWFVAYQSIYSCSLNPSHIYDYIYKLESRIV